MKKRLREKLAKKELNALLLKLWIPGDITTRMFFGVIELAKQISYSEYIRIQRMTQRMVKKEAEASK